MYFSLPNHVFDDLLESSHRDDSNKSSNIWFGKVIRQAVSIEVNFTLVIWDPDANHISMTIDLWSFKLSCNENQTLWDRF